MDVTYVLPIRCGDGVHDHDELVMSLRGLASHGVEVIVADNSDDAAFEAHAVTFGSFARHLPPTVATTNGKVGNVLTGIHAASNDRVVIADDDVRYELPALAEIVRRLDDADVVVPANVFDPMPWHARWDTARTLLNRSFWIDYPGTLGVRRSRILAAGGYDGDVLFENLELIRTVRAAGGRVANAADVFVRRRPPTLQTFLGQRVRQAYDDLAQPAKLAVMLAIAPLAAFALVRGRGSGIVAGAATVIALAEVGRCRDQGTEIFPATATLWAPMWVGERAVCVWIAVARRALFGGVRYRDRRLRRAATPMRELRRRLAEGQAGGVGRPAGRERAAA